MPEWLVTVSDPEMAADHSVYLHASDELSALAMGAQAAIMADRRGAGDVPIPDYGNYMPMETRRAQRDTPKLLAKVASFATATASPP